MRHLISMLVENESGALSSVAGLFAARGYNIESLTVAPTEDATMSRMNIVTSGSDHVIEQITKQLNKLIDVVKLLDLTQTTHIERELMLIKIKTTQQNRAEVGRLSAIFRGKIIDVSTDSYIIEMTGTCDKLGAFIASLDDGAVLEVIRSGSMGIARRDNGLHL